MECLLENLQQLCSSAVVLGVRVSGELTCPYQDPAAHVMTCIKGMAPVSSHSSSTARKRRGGPVTEYAMGTPDLSNEYINYFCSDTGKEIVDCASKVVKQCPETDFNKAQAMKARAMCDKVTTDFKKSLACMNDSMESNSTLKCMIDAYIASTKDDRYVLVEDKKCSATAAVFNCMVKHVGGDCGNDVIVFAVSVMRLLETKRCTPIVEAHYKEPTSSSTHILPSLLALAISTILVVC